MTFTPWRWLDCYFCGKEFEDFTALRDHVVRDCKAKFRRRSTWAVNQEASDMARSKFHDRDGEPDNAPAPGWDDGEPAEAKHPHPVLGIDDLGPKMKASGTLTGEITPYRSTYGNGFFFGVTINGKNFDLRVKGVGKNYDAMRRVVPDSKKAKGVIVQLQILTFNDNDYVAVVG